MVWMSNCALGLAVSGKQSWLPITQGILLGKALFPRHPEVGKVTGEEQGLEKKGEGLGFIEAEQYITEDTTDGQDGSNDGNEDDKGNSEYQIAGMNFEVKGRLWERC